jgi:glutamate/tyrosine decarboxylase-like PLP-dependent enzyme
VPFVVIGTAGSVNVGAIDNLEALAEIAAEQKLWLHVDGAFGATAKLSSRFSERLAGLDRADSLAFDFHKWLHVNYDAGCVLIRSRKAHLDSFSGRPEYLAEIGQGLAAGNPWPVDFGPELSRGFRALKIWAHLLEHGVDKLAGSIEANCDLASHLAARIESAPEFELLAPAPLNIVCFRYVSEKITAADAINELNNALVIRLQQNGVAAPSTTTLDGKLAIRVNITNHRTGIADIDLLLDEARKIGDRLAAETGFCR